MVEASKPRRVFVAINPTASFGKGSKVGPAVVAALLTAGHDVTRLEEPSYAELIASAKAAIATGPDALIVVGGDGMVNLGTNLVAGTDVPLGIVPSGTGNDMARALGIPHENSAGAIDLLLKQLQLPARTIDAGLIHRSDGGETWYACMVSAGFDAVVNERANRMTWPKGPMRYNLALLYELIGLKPIRYTLTFDGEVTEVEGMMISVGNGVSLGGGMLVTPDAEVDDGLLDVLVVGRLTRLQFLRIFPRVFRGEHLTDPRVTVRRVKRVTIAAEGVAAYGDGERVGPLPVTIEVRPGALKVLAPARP
ncbi:YegS/Rv2252/BmrU family lipid kinase [Lacisediminihabitans changchengi]|uniref:YegS/Rv2252/BmrU family lipid kinase n=1 Tax=Lacisediminihabitans changchengi TaxID=2787634 RepID=A0A934SJ70_9MICO|nr:YegS/Rv2252/BmrU family lipid kinase [Lacisediminihabitans changchengi]MBK4346270.1 YegS/Rv2252/BmrU family lipid kinase [Lacisediminihabitans changchengi]